VLLRRTIKQQLIKHSIRRFLLSLNARQIEHKSKRALVGQT
jgi:hypothetical protein